MSSKIKELSLELEAQRARLESRANVIRSRLLRTVDALDNRRHQVQELGHHVKRLAVPAVASLVGLAVVAVGTSLAIRGLFERRRERSLGYRMSKALAPLRREPPRPPLWKEALRKVVLAAVGVLATELGRRGVRALMQGRGPLALLPIHAGSGAALIEGTADDDGL